jgi:lipopolysaccharide/colanic/teichoic acid biosynthesis glycosyltransferase
VQTAGPTSVPIPRHAGYRGKRVLDVLVAGTALVLTAPVLGVAALLVRLETPGHAIYRQRRVGRDGAPFELYKLRTMVHGAEQMGAGLAVNVGDERITRVGAVLRRTSLDELPNLFNVLAGEMSIVGPRPTVQVQVDRYTERQRGRLAVRPGITGWAQVNGLRGETDTVDKMQRRVEYDLDYLRNWSLGLDLTILLRTAALVVRDRNAY